jgi:hypothetical protein
MTIWSPLTGTREVVSGRPPKVSIVDPSFALSIRKAIDEDFNRSLTIPPYIHNGVPKGPPQVVPPSGT